jgi:hypothetical protein
MAVADRAYTHINIGADRDGLSKEFHGTAGAHYRKSEI